MPYDTSSVNDPLIPYKIIPLRNGIRFLHDEGYCVDFIRKSRVYIRIPVTYSGKVSFLLLLTYHEGFINLLLKVQALCGNYNGNKAVADEMQARDGTPIATINEWAAHYYTETCNTMPPPPFECPNDLITTL